MAQLDLANLNIDNPKIARAVIFELQRRARLRRPPPVFLDPYFPKQTEFQLDPARFKAAQCTRRAGKSYGAGLMLCAPAYNEPAVTCGYIALTRESARKIMWRDVLKNINRRLDLEAKFNESRLEMIFPNESVVSLQGADASDDEMEKFLGQKFRRLVIDECASYHIDLRKLVYEILTPATTDHQGEIILIGTPGEVTKGFFFDVTNRKEPGWSVHKWSGVDNPYMRDKFIADMEFLMKTKPGIEQTPAFRRMYLNEWVLETSNLVYKYDRERNWIPKLPEDTYYYVLGIDLGFEDESAFSILAFSDNSPNLYITHVYKRKGMIISDVVERIRYYQKLYPIHKMIVDGASKQAVEEMRQRYSLPLEAAEKHGKPEFIEIMNSEFIRGTIKLVGFQETRPLEEEYGNLIWDQKEYEEKRKKVEHSACPNHLADATLYGWRYAYNYHFKEKKPDTRNEEQKLLESIEQEAHLIAQIEETPFWMREA